MTGLRETGQLFGGLRVAPIGIILFSSAALLAWQAWHLGVTSDETSHLTAAYMYWRGQDVLYPSDSPPLTRIISGWVPRALNVPLPPAEKGWRGKSAYDVGDDIVKMEGASSKHRLMFLMRLPFLTFPLGIVFLTWQWARSLFDRSIAGLLATCAALEPTILGHGALINPDVSAAFGALLFAYAAWRYWKRPEYRTLAVLALALLIAVLAKFTLLPLVFLALILVAFRGPRLAGVVIILLTFYFGTIAAYQFDTRVLSAKDLEKFRNGHFSDLEIVSATVLGRLPWPPRFIEGIQFVGSHLRGNGFGGYMLGHSIVGNAPWYYPLAFAIKFPIPLQLLTLAGIVALIIRLWKIQARIEDAFIWAPPVFVVTAAIWSSYHIGFRHVLPALPFFIIGGGFALQRWKDVWPAKAISVGLVAWLAISSISVYPQGISYFNEWIGGPRNGWRYLADSNIDWGQNFPELGAFVREHSIPRIGVYLFGADLLEHYLPGDRWKSQPAPWAPSIVKGHQLIPAPGYHAISANLLTGFVFAREYEDYFAAFRNLAPVGRAGYSILIFEIK